MGVAKRSWSTPTGVIALITVTGAAMVSCSEDEPARITLAASDAAPATGGLDGTGGRGNGGASSGGTHASGGSAIAGSNAGGDAAVPDSSAGGSSGGTGGAQGNGGAAGTGGAPATGGASATGGAPATGGTPQSSGGAAGAAGDASTGEPICGHRNEACCAGNACVESNTTCFNSQCFACGSSFAALCCASSAGTTCNKSSLACAGTGCTCYEDCVHVSNTTTVLRSDGSVWGQKPGSLPSALRGVGGQIVTGFTRLRAGLGRTATTVFACGTISGGAACWGDVTGFGGLGDGTSSASATPVAVRTAVSGPLLQAVTDLAVGNAAACAVSSGNVYCWGSNANGMLGANAAGDSMFAVQVVTATGPLGGVSQVSLGGSHGCAVTTTGKVYCWGSNSSGQLGRVGAGSPIAVEVTAIPSTATQVVAGVGGTAARMSDGTAWTWGAGSCQASGTLPALVMSGGTALTGVAEVLEDSFGTTYLRMTDGTSPVYSCASSAPLATIRDGANTPVTDFYRLTGPGSYADLCSVRQDGTLWVAHNTPLTEIEGPPCP